jgi:predicted amidophosphoribosyltransferase
MEIKKITMPDTGLKRNIFTATWAEYQSLKSSGKTVCIYCTETIVDTGNLCYCEKCGRHSFDLNSLVSASRVVLV